ncbi:helix-turn-helix domain-containing protein [Streptomyces sp. MMBL 11-3]|uniref:helix-turn-helix domain-containing protein n=1 Tax=Streptomyces sp. MMBL 11-3 TaxID=3382639 RepID=UPI0039B43D3B
MPSEVVNELGSFLRSRREKTDPARAGVVTHTRRRVKGLRREELALLAGVSPSYYARLEQGRDRNPSREILRALATVLGLDDTERAYLWSLTSPAPSAADGHAAAETVRPGVAHLLRRWSDLPALVTSPRRDVLATTALAPRMNPAWTPGRNLVEFTFLDDRARQVYPDWQDISLQAVAGLRTAAATRRGRLDDFVATMRERSETFRALWDSHDVYERIQGAKRLHVAGVGELRLEYETFALAGPEGHVLYVYFGQPGSEDEEKIRRLAAECATSRDLP